ncbi:MAG: flagellar hook capping FlgD N-terminal domain-containing protein [Dethiobacteria bacterium]|nr:hypothetical protein [Bacillota bacterium]
MGIIYTDATNAAAVNSYQGRTASEHNEKIDRGIDRDIFLQLLVTQIRYQNPLGGGAQDTSSFITQLALLTIVEQLMQISKSLEKLPEGDWSTEALALLNKEVLVKTEEGERSGIVTAVRHDGSTIMLTVGSNDYPLHMVKEIRIRGSEND